MINFRKTKTGKIASVLVGLTMAIALLVGTAGTAQAALTTSQVDAIVALLESFGADQATITNVKVSLEGGAPVAPSAPAEVCGVTFPNDLQQGDSNADVKNLQVILNSDADTVVALSGVGSAGQETEYFGSLTKAAVIKFQDKYASEILAPLSIAAGTGYVGESTRAKLHALQGTCSTEGTTEEGTTEGSTEEAAVAGITVALASDTPLPTALVAGQAIADLAHYTLVNSGSEDVKVTKIVLNRIGVSADATLVNVYLFDGAVRLTDSATVSSGVITFVNNTGIITIPAGSSKVISVRSDILSSSNGEIVGVRLASVEASEAVTGTFPIEANKHSIASATLADVDFAINTYPSANTSLDPQDDYVMWKNTVSIGQRSVLLKSLRLRMIGSVQQGDLGNFRLFVSGSQVGSAVAQYDSEGYVTFDLSANPVELKTGTRIIKMLGDVIGGSGRDFKFSLRQPADIEVMDTEYKQNVLARGNSTTITASFAAHASGKQDVASGTLTITKKTDSPSGNITPDSSSVVLATFEVKAAGEPVKVENLTARANVSSANVGNLRNGALFADGVQVGSTADLSDVAAGTQYNLGSALIVTPGSPVTLEIRADIYDNDGTNNPIAAGDTITASIVAGVDNLQRINALTYFSNSAVSGNTRTVAVGAITGSKYNAYGNQTVVVPQTAYKIGDFRVTANSAELVNLDTVTLTLGGAPVASTTDLYIKYNGKTSGIKGTGATTQSWSISEELAANATMAFEVYGTIALPFNDGDTVTSTLTVDGSSNSSSSVTTGAITGQTITAAVGSISSEAITAAPVEVKLLVGGTTDVKVASFRIKAVNQDYKVTDIAIKVTNSNSSAAIVKAVLKNGTDVLYIISSFDSNNTASSTGLALKIPANDSAGKVVDVYLDLNTVAAGSATSTADVKVILEGFKYQPWNGGTEAEDAGDKDGNSMYVVKSKPTVDMVAPSDLVLGNTNVLAKVSIDADTAGSIGWKKLVFTVSKTAAVTIGATSTMQLVDSNNNVIAGTFATTTPASIVEGTTALPGYTSGTVSFVADAEQEITSETYSWKGTVGGIGSAGYYYLSVSVAAPTGAIATPDTYTNIAGAAGDQTPSFVWSDRSANSHSETTPDWLNDYKVKELPTDPITLSKTI